MTVTLTSPDGAAVDREKVGIADLAVVTDDTQLVTSGLGSCIGIALYDSEAGVSGLLHAMLPTADDGRSTAPEKYVDTGLEQLISAMQTAGAQPQRLHSWIAGGSQMLEFSGGENSIGARNIRVATQQLSARSIPTEGADTGGSSGRSLIFNPTIPGLIVRTAKDGKKTL